MRKHAVNSGNLIKESRVEAGISQLQAAKLLGYKNGQIVSNIERGKQGIPLASAARFCKHLRINPTKLKEALMIDHKVTIDTAF